MTPQIPLGAPAVTSPGFSQPGAPRFIPMLAVVLAVITISVRANVYPTNIKFDDSSTDIAVPAGNSVRISYILNEPASAGVAVNVLAGNTVVRTISLAGGAPGTLRGTNTVVWDGNGNDSNPVAVGTYSVAITAASHGYSVWTQTTDDYNEANPVWEGHGIAVDQNTNSPYYGRIFVANAQANDPLGHNWLGYQVGIVKCNADASYADEGGFSTGGYPWAGDTFSPWHLEVSGDDFVYIDDATTNGQVIRWDTEISTNSQLLVLGPDNWLNLNVSLSGPAIFGSGTNTSLWMADATFAIGSQIGIGILRYPLAANGTCATNDPGTIAVAVGGSLTGNPVDVALDAAGNIYTIEARSEPGDSNNRVFRFPPYDASTNGPGPETNADWAVGSGDDTMAGASGIAVDPTGTYVAVAFTGLSTGTNGCTQILYATNGALVTNLDLGVVGIQPDANHEDTDCAWDAVGNVYYVDNYYGFWRAYSPPGTNQATTIALATIQVGGTVPSVPPHITKISVTADVVTIDFSAGTNDTALAFSVQGATNVTGPYTLVTSAMVTRIGPGQFTATLSAGAAAQYFRIVRQGTIPPPSAPSFTIITRSGTNLFLTFTGSATDSTSTFTLLSAAVVNGSYFPTTNATFTLLSPGVFQASIPAAGPTQFYRVRK